MTSPAKVRDQSGRSPVEVRSRRPAAEESSPVHVPIGTGLDSGLDWTHGVGWPPIVEEPDPPTPIDEVMS